MHSSPLIPRCWFALEIFILDAQSRNLSPRSIRYYEQQIGWFIEFLTLQGCEFLNAISAACTFCTSATNADGNRQAYRQPHAQYVLG